MSFLQDLGSGVCRAVLNGPRCYDPDAMTGFGIALLTMAVAAVACTRFFSRA